MTPEQVVQKLGRHRREIVSHGVRRLALFGSLARGEDVAGNDVDTLVAFEGQTTGGRDEQETQDKACPRRTVCGRS